MEVIGQQRLADKVSSILDRIEMELDEADSNIGQSMHMLDLDGDGLVNPYPPPPIPPHTGHTALVCHSLQRRAVMFSVGGYQNVSLAYGTFPG